MSKKIIGIIATSIIIVSIAVSFLVLNDSFGLFGHSLEPDESRVFFDNYVQSFDEILQQKFDTFLDDDVISQDEVNQINFLKQFTKSQQIEFIQNDKHIDFD